MAMTRRAVLKAFVATGGGAVTGAARTDISTSGTRSVTRADAAGRRLPPALAGLRIGLLTDIHRSRWVSHEDVARRASRC